MYIRFNSSCCKTFLVYFISFFIIYTPTLVFAGAAKKWEVVQNVYDSSKKSVNLTAKKVTQEAANSAVYKVQVPVDPATLGSTVSMMIRGGVASAAVYALVEGVGWVIDEGSKTIKKPKDTSPDLPTFEYVWVNGYDGKYYQSSRDSASAYLIVLIRNNSDLVSLGSLTIVNINLVKYDVVRKNGSSYSQYVSVSRIKNPKYNPAQEPQFDIISDSQLGNEILGNGTQPNSKPQPAPDIIADAYSPNNPVPNAPAPQAINDALNNANPEPESPPQGESKPKPNVDTDGDGKPDVYDPAKPSEGTDFTWPNACEWFPAACDFFTVQKQDNRDIKENQKEDIAQNKTFFEKIEDWFDWTKEEDDSNPDDTDKPEIEEPDLSVGVTNYIQFGSQCPADREIPLSMGSQTLNLIISYQPLCTVAQQFRPAVILMAFLAGAFIITNTGRRAETGD